jgi:hypothetical protein
MQGRIQHPSLGKNASSHQIRLQNQAGSVTPVIVVAKKPYNTSEQKLSNSESKKDAV